MAPAWPALHQTGGRAEDSHHNISTYEAHPPRTLKANQEQSEPVKTGINHTFMCKLHDIESH